MKKIRIFLIGALLIALACTLLIGCSNKEKVTAIAIKDSEGAPAIEVKVGEFDYSSYTLAVTYSSGSVVEVALSEDMISELDRLKLYQPGDHVITVSYGGCSCLINVSVKRATFGLIKFPDNNVFTYDGKAHKVEVEGELPANAMVSYIGANSFVNAGSYDVTAVITCNGYETERITTTVTIERAKYDMSGVKLESKEVIYDGTAHTIAISGKLPPTVPSPTYYIDGNKTEGVKDAGVYTVSAVFDGIDPNYEPIPPMEATLKIAQAEYELDGVDMVYRNESGAQLYGAWKKYDGKSVILNVDEDGALSNNVTVSYKIYNESGDLISTSNMDTKIKDSGVYKINVEFKLLDNKNYKAIEPMEFEFSVYKAEFNTSNLTFDSVAVEYDGNMHSLAVSFPHEIDQTKVDVRYEYLLGGEIVKNGEENVIGVCNAGEYTVNAIFTVKDPNYDKIDPMQATIVIEKKTISVGALDFSDGNVSTVEKGSIAYINFDTWNIDGLIFTTAIYQSVDDELVTVVEPKKVDREGYDSFAIAINATELDTGKYVCIVTASVESSNYVMQNGNTTVEYYFNFEIVN